MRKFYQQALPTQGVYCVTGISREGQPLNLFVDNHEELFNAIEELKAAEVNVFVAPGSFHDDRRLADNSAYLRSFFVDLDVGSNKAYKSQDEALLELELFLDRTGLPPPVRINSGGGVHAYWVFDRDVPAEEWKLYAKKFKAFCKQNDLNIDPAVTADAARIMRCPDTVNYKYDVPQPTSVLPGELVEYDWDMFKEFLGEVNNIEALLASIPKGLDEDTKSMLKLGNFEHSFHLIAERSLNDAGCEQIKNILINAATLEEPLWYAGLSIARHCVDWEEAIHLMSEDYPGYNHARTIKKANQTVGKPQGCAKFEELNPQGCAQCPHRGKITNPLILGRVLRESSELHTAPPKAVTDPFQANSSAATTASFVASFPARSLLPYARGAQGGIYYSPPPVVDKKTGKVVQDPPVLLTPYDFYPVKRMFSSSDGACLLMRVVLPKDPMREFNLPMKDVYLQERFKEILTRNEVLFNPSVVLHVMNYVIKWGQYLVDKDAAEQMRMQMGFTESGDSFVIGNTEITRDGRTLQTAASPFVRGISKLLKPAGSYDEWKRAAQALNEPGFEMHAFTMLTGFGSPLMRMTSTSGVMISLLGKTGHAKTGALYAGLSVFGNPKELSVFDATDNGMIGRYLGLHNIMLGCDEVSNKRSDTLSNLIHRISHGKAKIRMQASVNAERELEMSASLIGVMTTNQSIYDKLTEFKSNPDGEVARLVEFVIHKPHPLEVNPLRGPEIFDTFRVNYGHAGPDFIRHYFKVGDAYVKSLINKWSEQFIKDFGSDVAYRFYENLIATTMTAGDLINEAEILTLDLSRVYKEVVTQMLAIKNSTVKLNATDYHGVLSEFIHRHHSGMLIMNKDRVTAEPRTDLVMRSEIHNEMLYVSKSEFKKYLAGLQISSREFEFSMKQDGLLVFNDKHRLSKGWRAGVPSSPIAVYGFKYDLPNEILMESLKQDKKS